MEIKPRVATIIEALETPGKRLGFSQERYTFLSLRKSDLRDKTESQYALNELAIKINEIALNQAEIKLIQDTVEKRIESLNGRVNCFVRLLAPKTSQKVTEAVKQLKDFSKAISVAQEEINPTKVLKKSDFSGNLLKEIDISEFKQLEELDLNGSPIEKITGLNSSKTLRKLDLSTCRSLKEIDLSGLSQLEEIDLSHSSIERITGLSSLKALKRLNLSGCSSLKEIDLNGLDQLEEIELNGFSITEIVGLRSSKALKKLTLFNCNSLQKIDLSGLNQLEELDIGRSSIERITGLSSSKALKRINLFNCNSLEKIDLSRLSQLEEIDINHSSIKKILGLSSLKALKKLGLNNIDSLQKIDLSGLTYLERFNLSYSSIEEIKGLGSSTKLKELNLFGCKCLKKLNLSGLKQLEEIHLDHSSIEEVTGLSSLGSLKKLEFSSCNHLKEVNLSGLSQLEDLGLSHSPIEEITGLSSLKALKKLEFSNCNHLKEMNLSGLSQLEDLDLSHSSIEEIIGLSSLASVKKIDVSFCDHLRSIDLSSLNSLEEITCRYCPQLTTIGEAIPNCSLLNCVHCPQLINLPQVPFTATVYSGQQEFFSFYVNPEELDKHPFQLLLNLGKHLLANRPMPNIVWMNPFTKQPAMGLDAGGLRRQLITTLTENLFKENSEFPFIEESGGKLPALDDPSQEETVLAFRTFARLIALCSTSSLLMGKHLPLSFFFALKALADQDIDSVSFDKPLEDSLKRKIYAALLGEDDMEVNQEDLEQYPVMFPIAIIAKEMKNTPDFSFSLLRNEPEKFASSVQGKPLTREAFLNQLQCDDTATREYFKRYLEENSDKLATLLELFTGCQTLGKDPIVIRVYTEIDPLSFHLPSIHTCSQEVDMPFYPNYETFKAKIDASFGALKTFETI